ncbi:MAG TPA: trigger factor [Methylocella sp.]|nr:trigger factor [Methylocella sp.]
MQVTQTQAQGLKREFKVVVAAADLSERVEGQLAEVKAKAQIPGFRPGKVPVSHLRRLYGRSILADVIQDTVNEAHRKIIEDNELRLAASPQIIFPEDEQAIEKSLTANTDLAFTIALEVLPKIEIDGFSDVAIERLVADVTDEDVDRALHSLAEQSRPFNAKDAEATADKGDKATLDFIGKIDDVAFEGGAGQNVDVILGSRQFIPGFEEQIEGMKAGERKAIVVTFPDDYSAASLAGKTATFDITLLALASPGEIVIDDEFAKSFGFEDLGKLKEKVRDNIERDHQAASRGKWKRELLDALDRKYLFDVPESMVTREFDTVWRSVEDEQKRSGRSFEDEDTTEAAARLDYLKIAERRVRLGLLLAEIGAKADIKVSDEEVNQALIKRVRAFPGQERVIWDYYQKNPNALTEFRAPLFEEKVIDYLLSQINVTDKKVSKDQLFKASEADEEDKNEENGTAAAAPSLE